MDSNFSGDFGVADNMKIIIQSEVNDRSTDEVLQWIKYLNSNTFVEILFGLFNSKDLKLELTNSHLNFKLNEKSLSLKDSYWNRRGYFII
jgi:hypothetical protein